jgi:hypothetical protein
MASDTIESVDLSEVALVALVEQARFCINLDERGPFEEVIALANEVRDLRAGLLEATDALAIEAAGDPKHRERLVRLRKLAAGLRG